MGQTDGLWVINLIQVAKKFAENFAREFVPEHQGTQPLGGSLCVMRPDGVVSLQATAGCVTDRDREKEVTQNAFNKCKAILQSGSAPSSFVLADESADPPIYGGGILLLNGWAIAFSGFPAEWDEAFCVGLAAFITMLLQEKLIDLQQMNLISEHSDNMHNMQNAFRFFREVCRD